MTRIAAHCDRTKLGCAVVGDSWPIDGLQVLHVGCTSGQVCCCRVCLVQCFCVCDVVRVCRCAA